MSLRIFTTLLTLAGLGLYTLSLLPDLPDDPADSDEAIVAASEIFPSDIELHLLVYREPGHYEWLVDPPALGAPQVQTAVARTSGTPFDSLIPDTQNRKPLNQEVSL